MATRYGRLLRYEESEDLYRRALAIDNEDFEAVEGLQNCLRRYAGFLQGINYAVAVKKYFEALDLAGKMRNLANEKDQVRRALLARPKTYWEWSRFQVAADEYRDLITRDPSDRKLKLDLAAVLVEDGQMNGRKDSIQEGYDIYLALFKQLDADASPKIRGPLGDLTFCAQGVAEASAELRVSGDNLSLALRAASIGLREAPKRPVQSCCRREGLLECFEIRRRHRIITRGDSP